MMELRVRKWTPHCLASRALAQELFSLCREMKMAASQAAKENLLVANMVVIYVTRDSLFAQW